MALAPGTRLGTYEILAPLGAGGMGEVYRAKDLRLGRDVALKVLPAGLAADPERLARLEREARVVAALNHPNIVTLHSVEDEGDVRFLTMEMVEGRRLDTLVVPDGLPLARVLDLVIPLADALNAAHARGVVHRDLKPANVMVTGDDRVKVLDFGLARPTTKGPDTIDSGAATASSPISSAGQAVGTIPYMSPEQLRGQPVDARSDLFSLGVILYELAAGRRPFAGDSAADVSSAILRDDPEPLGRVRDDLPEDLERIVAHCLAKEPRARVQSALEVSNELRALRRSAEQGGGPVRRARPTEAAAIAVLPFVNRSRDEEDVYFSDGLADELLNLLSKIQGLRVAARASSFQFRDKKDDLAAIAQKLNVGVLLDGSVRKAGARVRVSVQLINPSDGYHLWSETYDRTLDDIFALQDDIAQSVVRELRTALLGEGADSDASVRVKADVARAARGRGRNAEAHQLALQGRHMIERLTADDVRRGIEYLQRAIETDPDNAVAWVDLSRAHLNAAGHGWAPRPPSLAEARRAVERALAIAPDLPEAHVVLGRLRLYFDWDWKGAAESYRRAMELAPDIAVGRHGAGILAQNAGRFEEALDLYRRAVDQDPLSAAAHERLGVTWLVAGRSGEAEAALRKAIALSPQRIHGHFSLALALLAQGRLDEALDEAKHESDPLYRHLLRAVVLDAGGRRSESDVEMKALVEAYSANGAFQIAEAYAARGEIDAAFEWLDRARVQRDPGCAEVKCSYLLQPLRGDPRWEEFMKKMGLD